MNSIGILSDGLEGISLLRCLSSERMAAYSLFFFGDTLRAPVGFRSRDAVMKSAEQGARLLQKKGIGAIILSDGLTGAAPCLQDIPDMPPIFTAIEATAEMAVRKSRKGRIAVLGAPSLLDSGAYQEIIQKQRPDARVSGVSMPLLEPMVREGRLNKPETRMIIKKYLHRLKSGQTDLLICADGWAAPFLPLIREKIGKRALVLHSAAILADLICRELQPAEAGQTTADTGPSGQIHCEVTDIGPSDRETARRLFGRPLSLHLVRDGGNRKDEAL